MADVTPRENALFFLILNRSIYLSNWIRIAIFAFKFHESYFLSTSDVFSFFLSFLYQEVKLQVQVLPTLKFQRTWKILNTIYLLWKILRLLRWLRYVSLFEYYRALIFCPLQLLYLNYQTNHTSKGGHIVKWFILACSECDALPQCC